MILSGLSDSSSLPVGSRSAVSQVQLRNDLNRFLNLLVTQLKNQDPLDPMDATEFTSQLVQFASVEQQIYQNTNLETLIGLEQAGQVSSMVDFLGLSVEYDDNRLWLADGGAEFSYFLPSNVASARINIKDASGTTVYLGDGEASAGRNTFAWDGRATGGLALAEGLYTVTVTVFDAAGRATMAPTTMFGRVTGAGAEDGQVYLFTGDYVVPMNSVLSVREPPASLPTSGS